MVRQNGAADAGGGAEPYRCRYCGGALDMRYHFCVQCAIKHRAPDDDVYGEVPESVPTLEARLRTEGRPAFEFFCVLAVLLVVMAVLREVAGKGMLGSTLLVQELALGALTIAFAVKYHGEIAHLFTHIRVGWPLLACVPLLGVLLAANFGYHGFVRSLLGSGIEDTFAVELAGLLPPVLLLLCGCVLPALFEEVAFRGFVQERFVRAAGMGIGFAATGVLFVALHFTVLSAPYLFVLSIFLSWARAATHCLYVPMALHFAHNAVVFLVIGEGL